MADDSKPVASGAKPQAHILLSFDRSDDLKPTPCLRCESALPLTTIHRNELYFYTARLGLRLNGSGVDVDTDVAQQPRGRLCEECTLAFVEWLKP